MRNENANEPQNQQSCQNAVIASAVEVVKELADKYKPKQNSTWFEYQDKDWCRCSFDEDQGTYCEDCIDEREEEILKNENNEINFPDDFEELIQSVETSKENEGFLNCDSCGEIIECAIIWGNQDLEEWTKLGDENWLRCKNTEYYYYQVYKILEQNYGASEEFNSECLIIAQKVLEHWL